MTDTNRIEFTKILQVVAEHLSKVTYDKGDMSDIGNEIGIAISKAVPNITDEEIVDFIVGLNHGLDLAAWDETLQDGLEDEPWEED